MGNDCYYFYGDGGLNITASDNLNISGITNMKHMFHTFTYFN
ncbi:MAG: hypothetical protein PF569_05120 [Candidatus Woesearchaeota archaeon]|nr:hypothetical protein [Candidatus Woesearchaeota archaeon]